MSWNKVVFDVEIAPDFFCVSFMNYDTKEKITYEISLRVNDLPQIFNFWQQLNQNRNFVIGFNSNHYDIPMMNYLVTLLNKNVIQLLYDMQDFSDLIINNDKWFWKREYKNLKYPKGLVSIDLYVYWSKMLRLSKKISLKSLGIQLGYRVVQELPYKPGTPIGIDNFDKVIHYNRVHDLNITYLLCVAMKKDISLRYKIKKETGLKCMSYDAPKIASEWLLDYYVNTLYPNQNNYKIKRAIKEDDYRFHLKLPLEPIEFKLPIFQNLYKLMSNVGEDRDLKEELVFIHKNTKIVISYGIGGIHSVNNNEFYKSDDSNYVYTSDISSLYPNVIINYKLIRQREVLEYYTQVKDDRMVAKRAGDKHTSDSLKLILNSTSGLLDSPYSWLFYPEGALKLRLMGQLILTKTVEELAIAGFQVVSVNTDGVECIVPKNREEEYLDIVNTVGAMFDLEYEHEIYKAIYYSNVNNYIAIKEDEVKRKGLFKIDFNEKGKREIPLGDSVNFLIIPKALTAYYVEGIKPEIFIPFHKNIHDFCASKKVARKYTIYWNNEEQQRLNRFYISKKGAFLYKKLNGKMTHMMKGHGVYLYNEIQEEFPTNIDYNWYINKVRKLIGEIEPNQLTMF